MKRSREPQEARESASPGSDDLASSSPSDEAAEPAAKMAELDPALDGRGVGIAMKCAFPPHKDPVVFQTYEEYESHYVKVHTNRCVECRKNFPSAHLLDLHIEECHDAFLALKREKGEHTFSCFVEGCERKCRTPQKRRMHLIDKHLYPRNFFFAITRDGIDGRQSLLTGGGHGRRRSSTTNETRRKLSLASRQEGSDTPATGAGKVDKVSSDNQMQNANPSGQKPAKVVDADMENLTEAMSSLRFVPSSVRFGRRGGNPGFSTR